DVAPPNNPPQEHRASMEESRTNDKETTNIDQVIDQARRKAVVLPVVQGPPPAK
ncbi:hypothetical protein BGX26_006268, partial [Mortierella sp. AD094]